MTDTLRERKIAAIARVVRKVRAEPGITADQAAHAIYCAVEAVEYESIDTVFVMPTRIPQPKDPEEIQAAMRRLAAGG